jgi:hypothetical protein
MAAPSSREIPKARSSERAIRIASSLAKMEGIAEPSRFRGPATPAPTGDDSRTAARARCSRGSRRLRTGDGGLREKSSALWGRRADGGA